jgi:formylglycine-generating enzyme required for sulfatase activity
VNNAQAAAKLSKRLNNQAETVGELSKQLTALDNKQAQAADNLSKRLTVLSNKQAQTATKLSKRLNKHIQTAGGLFKEIATLDNKQAEMVDKLSNKLTVLDNKQAETANELSKRVTALEETKHVLRDRLKDGTLGPEMVVIPAGKFRMGDIQGGGGSDEQPVHDVSVKRFAMGRYEVTFAEYDKFAEATARTKPSDNGWGRGNRPVINVSWNNATAYAKWLTEQTGHHYRLPTEAEWEYSARAGTTTKYWWGNTASHEYANYGKDKCCSGLATGKDRWKYTSPVGSFAANPFGLFDTAGNVWEWTCSEYTDKYTGKEQHCAKSASRFAARGASWGNEAGRARSASRGGDAPTNRFGNLGVRLVRQ